MSIRTPAFVFPPGDFIRDELEVRGWTQADLAKIMNRPAPAINLIITGKKSITPTTALELSGAFGTSPEFWLNLETAYRLSTVRTSNQDIRNRAKIFESWPVKEMEDRKWIRRTGSVEQLRAELDKFSSVATDRDLKLRVAARAKAQSSEAITPEQHAWCLQALRMAGSISAGPFRVSSIAAVTRSLRALVRNPQDTRRVPSVLLGAGIRLVVVKHLAKTKIDGAALWLGDGWDKPIVALSMRHDRIDYFWYTLFHELAHIAHKDSYVVDDNLRGSRVILNLGLAEIEERADREAANNLIPTQSLNRFIAETRPYYSKDRIKQFAALHEIHPGIVAGQLQHRGETPWSANREMLERVRDHLLKDSVSDGW